MPSPHAPLPALTARSATRGQGATVAIGFVTGMLSGMHARGQDPAPLLYATGIMPASLDQPSARVPLQSYALLYKAVTRHLNDEAFGLFELPMRPGAFELLCRGLLGSQSLDQALTRCSRYLSVLLPELGLSVDTRHACAVLHLFERRPLGAHRNDPRRVFAFEWLLRLVHGLACWLVARSVSLASVQFPFERPAHADDYRLIYTASSYFGGNRLEASFAANLLTLPIRRDDTALASFLEGGPETLTMLYRRDRETLRVVRDALITALPAAPTLDHIARAMHVSPRTLHRRLVQEGTSFRAIKEALRRDIALARLERQTLPVSQLAQELGYAETSAFFRAFRKWTGQAPSRYRSRQREK